MNKDKKDSPKPPAFADKLLKWFCASHLLETIQGDLHEEFQYQVGQIGERKARWLYLWEVLGFIKPRFIKRNKTRYPSMPFIGHVMIRNYFKVAIRNLDRQKISTGVNVLGLAIGLTTCLLIMLYVQDELSYDRHNEKAARIFRVNVDAIFGGTEQRLTQVGDALGPVLKKDYPQVEEYVRFFDVNASKFVRKGNEYIDERRSVYADPAIFDVFTLPAIYGDTKTALNAPASVVITESTARKYFGTVTALGKTLEVNKAVYNVTAIIRDIPSNAHFHFDFIFSMKAVKYDWGNFLTSNFQTYIVLKDAFSAQDFSRNFTDIIEKYIFPQAKQHMQMKSAADFNRGGNKFSFTLTPLTDIHLRSDRQDELEANGNIQIVYAFSAIGLFVLLIACVNFMNLSTARSTKRAREVGIRKTMGTSRNALITQFLVESIVTASLSLLLALVLAAVSMPLFNELSGKMLSIKFLFSPAILPYLLLTPVIVGCLAGSYPALFLSGFQPVAVLKAGTGGLKKGGFRNALVVFQFAVSMVLIIGTSIIHRQLNFIRTKNLGFNKEQILIINGTHALGPNITAFKDEILVLPGVTTGTLSGFLPVSSSERGGRTFSKAPVSSPDNMFDTQTWTVDYDYIETMGMKMVQGRNFSKDFGSDNRAVVINESMAKLLGYANPVGQKIYPVSNGTATPVEIIGMVKDFNYESLRKNIAPLLFSLGNSTRFASFRVNTVDLPDLLKQVNSSWKKFPTGAQFSYQFMDEAFDKMYRAEQRVGQISMIFAGLAIFIACLGLFGLAAYMAEQRTKEIGIRKVLGATAFGIVSLLSREFLKLVLVAILIASPLAWYIVNRWLVEFAYKISIEWWVFVLTGLASIGIALLTVSYQSIKAALTDPVKSLRSE